MISDGCLAHKTAVALAALSQYVRFLISSTSAADHHLLTVNFLVEPYRLPQKDTMSVTQSMHIERLPSHVGNTGNHVENQQVLVKAKDSGNLADVGHPDDADNGEIDIAEEKKFPADKKIAPVEDKNNRQLLRGGESQQDGDYDENTEVELDKDDIKLVQSRDPQTQGEEEQNVMVTDVSLLHRVIAHPALMAAAAAGEKRLHSDSANVRVLVKSHWFLSTVAVFLLLFWFRCMRCFRCGFLMRRCYWI